MAVIGDAAVEVMADTSRFEGSLKNSLKTAGKVAAGVFVAAAAVAGGAIKAAFDTAAFGDEVAKAAGKAGLAVEPFQELRFAFGQGGVEAATFNTAMQKFNKRLGESATTGGTADAAFEALGISLRDADGNVRDATEAMDEALPKLAAIESDAERAAIAGDLFGQRAGPELSAALSDGIGGIDAAREKAQELGIVMDEEATTAAEEFTDAWDDLKQSSGGFLRDAAGPLVVFMTNKVFPALQDGIGWLREMFDVFGEGDGVVDGLLAVFGELTGGGGISSIFEKVSGIVRKAFANIVDWLASGGIEMILNTLLQARERLLNAALVLFPAILDALIQFLPSLLSFITESLIPSILDFITNGVPKLLKTALELFTTLIDAVVEILPGLLDTLLGTVLPKVLQTVLSMIPQLLTAALTAFTTLIDAVVEILPKLLQTLLGDVLPNVLQTILGMIPELLTTAVELFMTLIDAVIDVLPVLLTTLLVDVLPKLLTTILDMIPELLVAAIDAFLALVTGLLEVLPDLVTTLLVDVLPELITTLLGMIPQLIETGITVFVALVDALIDAIPEITAAIILDLIPAIVEAVLGMGSQLYDAGKEVLDELLGGIKDKAGEVIAWVQTNVVDKITRMWPFSPAKEGPFRRFPPEKAGENIMSLFAEGIAKGGAEAVRAASQSMEGLVSTQGLGNLAPADSLGGMAPRLAAGAAGMGNVTFDVTVAVNGSMSREAASEAGRTMAQEARRELDRLSRARVAR